MSKRTISFVLPVFNEQENIRTFYKELKSVIQKIEDDYRFELIFINDGSRDKSIDVLSELQSNDTRVKVLDFSRNFGHQAAITAGMDHATGNAVIIMDTDLQDPPSVCLDLIKEWEQGVDVAYAQRRTRKDTFFKRVTANIYYRLIRRISSIDIPRNVGDFRLMDRRVVDVLKECRETNRYVRGLVSYAGFTQKAVLFDRDPRFGGETGYSMAKMLKLATNGITSFSDAPLRMAGHLGFWTIVLAFIGVLYVVYMRIFNPESTVPGWSLLMIAILVLNSFQMFLLAIMGQYIGHIYSEVQRRPLYILKQKMGKFND